MHGELLILQAKIGRASPRTINDQKLLLQEQAVSDNGPRTARSQEFGDGSQKMGEE